jgi:translocation and assembly module TamB
MTARALRGVSGGGTVTLSGFVTLAETPRYDMRADLDQVRVRYPSDFTSVLNGSLRLVGTPERGQLGGDVTVRQTVVSENFSLLARMVQPNVLAGTPLPRITSPLASNIKLNVRVTSSPPVRLDTPEFRLVADLDLRFQGTVANPVEVGSIRILSGDAVFRGTRYKINRGEISLTNPFRTQPQLDVEAETRVERYDLTLDISGPLDRPKITYRSDPPLPTADILSMLALGFSSPQQQMATAGGGPMSTVGASALLSEALANQKTGRIQRLFGVSRIKIDPSVGGPGNQSGARVTVEQQVTRDFVITYATNTASSQYRVIQFEWTLNETVSLLGVRDQNGIFGMEVRFRRRFK